MVTLMTASGKVLQRIELKETDTKVKDLHKYIPEKNPNKDVWEEIKNYKVPDVSYQINHVVYKSQEILTHDGDVLNKDDELCTDMEIVLSYREKFTVVLTNPTSEPRDFSWIPSLPPVINSIEITSCYYTIIFPRGIDCPCDINDILVVGEYNFFPDNIPIFLKSLVLRKKNLGTAMIDMKILQNLPSTLTELKLDGIKLSKACILNLPPNIEKLCIMNCSRIIIPKDLSPYENLSRVKIYGMPSSSYPEAWPCHLDELTLFGGYLDRHSKVCNPLPESVKTLMIQDLKIEKKMWPDHIEDLTIYRWLRSSDLPINVNIINLLGGRSFIKAWPDKVNHISLSGYKNLWGIPDYWPREVISITLPNLSSEPKWRFPKWPHRDVQIIHAQDGELDPDILKTHKIKVVTTVPGTDTSPKNIYIYKPTEWIDMKQKPKNIEK